MPRPVKWRKVEYIPNNTYFVPCPKGSCREYSDVNEVQIKIEELEAMRLKDIEELSQEECAEKMEVSRQTFQNIIDEARKKVVFALVEGKAISIGGGRYTKKICRLKCLNCGKEFEASFEEDQQKCINCGSAELSCFKKVNGHKHCPKQSGEYPASEKRLGNSQLE
ncbi:UPF0251 protein [Syntrophobotulus glycolicus DSM 8271]|uniref:UPF0251 protein Sgly_1421 n=1 Tax=Syntrophobotulus glycolicus (strain DSM 8271 / FlGlyR) TaxID=645991 RepID=F0SWF8_SYNGF|nr:DUF134 domain-containing protein [Syntrophobotulus glycolicus]ADY55724.1 UPF0251 protein [Syntrophobotulus glycolicus DSM 8271]